MQVFKKYNSYRRCYSLARKKSTATSADDGPESSERLGLSPALLITEPNIRGAFIRSALQRMRP